MSSRNRNANKPELVAIYRLEFYKNKKNWKFGGDKQQRPAKTSKSTKVERNKTLNETYNVHPAPESENGPSTLNNAFMHITTDETPKQCSEPSPPPPTPQPQTEPHSDQIQPPQPVHQDKAWCNSVQTQPDKLCEELWSNLGLGSNQHLHDNAQEQPPWPNNTTDSTNNQNIWTNQDPPTNNLQCLLKNPSNLWHNPPGNSGLTTWNNLVKPGQTTWGQPTNYGPASQDTWQMPTPEKCVSESDFLQDQAFWKEKADFCPILDNQVPQKRLEIPNPVPEKKESSFILPDTSVPPPPFRKILQSSWSQEKLNQNVWMTDSPGNLDLPSIEHLLKPGDILETKLAQNFAPNSTSQSGQQKFLQGLWPNQGLENKEDSWRNEAMASPIEERPQTVWTNQAWQKKEDMWQNRDKEYCGAETEDAPDGIFDEAATYTEPLTQADQPTLKPVQSLNISDQSPEQVCQHTDLWLRRLMKVHHNNSHDQYDCEPICEYYQRGDDASLDFVREAHDVAHSSERDHDDTAEWVWSLVSPESLPALSTRRLSAAIRHVTNTLRSLLREQVIRDHLRAQRASDLEQYPSRDTELFSKEFVLAGSHLPRNTRDLTPTAGVIKINMGRPYRLTTSDNKPSRL